MFTSPIRQALSVRRGLNAGLLVGTASVSALLSLTPLVLPIFEDHFEVSVSIVGLASSLQVGAFALASFLGGRFLSASNRLFRFSLVALAVANVAAAFAPSFSLLVATRAVSGTAAGLVNWLAWRQAARIPRQMGSVAVIGPATAAVASVVLGFLIDRFGFGTAYVVLAGAALIALAFPIDIQPGDPVGRNTSPSRSNKLLLAALGCITLFGSAIFLFAGYYLGPERGAPPWLLAWALAGNAAAGIFGARRHMQSGGIWFLGTATCALVLGVVPNAWAGFLAMLMWGAFFWFAVPSVLRLIEDYSNHPGERSGDAQAVMAAGRVVGPLLGGSLIAAISPTALGIVAASGLAVGGFVVLGVERYRRTASV
ncbi:MAG: hypothetical protein JSV07_03030 [Acidimicrobiia bacterium]|nr:MAG: hypothetical protein JSV07_03030 [Acidimicrobiia bacterium]